MSGPKVTFYGHFSGWSSYPSVCRAIAKWLIEQGVDLELCDLREARAFEELEDIPRVSDSYHSQIQERAQEMRDGFSPKPVDAPGVSLLFGFPTWMPAIPRHEWAVGYHVGDVDQIPSSWVEIMNREDLILTPSQWCKLAFSRSGVRRPIDIVNHGVSKDFTPKGGETKYGIIHFCSSRDPSRKGSVELVEAVGLAEKVMRARGSKLHIYGNSSILQASIADHKASDLISLHQDTPGPASQMASKLRSAELLIQPSRAEGFGCLNLEALACGVPVVATSCTGHAEYLTPDTPGAVIIPTDRLELCGGARAPSLDPMYVAHAMISAIKKLGELRDQALQNAPKIQREWSWDSVLGRSPLLKALQYA